MLCEAKHFPQAEFISAEDVKSFKGPPANRRFDGDGGDKRDRTADPLLAKQVLSQLSYTPVYHRCFQRTPSKLNNVRLPHAQNG